MRHDLTNQNPALCRCKCVGFELTYQKAVGTTSLNKLKQVAKVMMQGLKIVSISVPIDCPFLLNLCHVKSVNLK